MKKTKFLFDLDGTVTKSEILPVIAKAAGIYDEIQFLTKHTIEGSIPFEMSFRLRVKLLESVDREVILEAIHKVPFFEFLSEFIRFNKDSCAIVTGNLDIWISDYVSNNLGCELHCSLSEQDINKNSIKITKMMNKQFVANKYKSEGYRVIAIGDGMGDVGMFEAADLGIAFAGVHSPIESLLSMSDYMVKSEESLCKILKELL